MEELLCKICKKPMLLDDIDYNFKGNQDNYYFCETCHIGVIEKIRYGKRFKLIWDSIKG